MLPCCSLWLLLATSALALKRREEEKTGRLNVALIWFGWLKIIDFKCFCWPLKSKIEPPRKRNANFHSWVTRLPIELNVHVANIFGRLLQIPAFCLLASKLRISNSSPLQGRRVNRLPCFFMLWRALPFILHLDRFRRRWSLVTRLHCAGTQTRTLRSIQLRYNRPIEAAHGWKFMRPCLYHLTRSIRMTQSETFQCRAWVRTCCLCPPHSLPSSGQSDVFWALLPRPWRQSREYALQILLNLLVSTETRTAQHQSYCSRWRCSGQGHSRVNVQEGGWGL